MNRGELLALVSDARRAPSVHNVQPARWRAPAPRTLELHADPTRRLPVADPSGHDIRLSLGAAFEGMAIALAQRGMRLGAPELCEGGALVARATLETGAERDPLGIAVPLRASYRGTFVPTRSAALDGLQGDFLPRGVVMVRDRESIRALAKMADRASDEFLGNPAYWRETWHWVRLDASHPGWSRDGLNADALALSGIERVLGRQLMAPGPFEFMRRLGLAGALISEAAKIESAGALLLFTVPRNEDPFVTGREFYRLWLEVTAAELALCPISVLADSKRTNDEIRGRFSIPAERRLVNVLRIGRTPAQHTTRLTVRLPAEDLILP